MKYSERYDLLMFRDGIVIWDTELSQFVNPLTPLEYVCHVPTELQSYEDSLAEAAWERSLQGGYTKGELQDQQAKNQKLK